MLTDQAKRADCEMEAMALYLVDVFAAYGRTAASVNRGNQCLTDARLRGTIR